MRFTIARRAFIALLVTSLVTIGLNMLLTRWTFREEFLNYKSEQEAELLAEIGAGFAAYHEQQGSWNALVANPQRWQRLLRETAPGTGGGPATRRIGETVRDHPPPPGRGPAGERRPADRPPNGPPPGPADPLDIRGRLALFDVDGSYLAGAQADVGTAHRREVVVKGAPVGTLYLAAPKTLTDAIDLQFDRGQTRSLILSSFAISILAVVSAIFLSRQMTRPVELLANHARSLTAGNYTDTINLKGNSELSDLAADFNTLASTLDRNRQSQREWISHTSHELRTPLAILTAELQAIEDGVRKFDDNTRASLQFEVAKLERLVADLSQLALADEGQLSLNLAATDLVAIIEENLDSWSDQMERAGLQVSVEVDPDNRPVIRADAARLTQMFANLIENSLRYTSSPGALKVSCHQRGNVVEVIFADSEPGVDEAVIKRVFDRLFRAETSRGRHSGGSGLGQSICKAIAEGHGATIAARQSALGGLGIHIIFPLLVGDEVS